MRVCARLAAIAVALGTFGCGAAEFGAASWPIDPGQSVELAPDEGLLVVHVQTNRPLRGIFIDRVRAAEDVPEGTQIRLIGVTAGDYRWSDIELPVHTFVFRDVESLRFRVEPGVINYVGMVEVEEKREGGLYMHTVDRSAIALAELRRHYPELASKYPVVYSGPGHHVFLGRYFAEKDHPHARAPAAPPEAAGVERRSVNDEALFSAPALVRVALNPSGTLSAALGYSRGTEVVSVRRTANAASTTVFSDPGPVEVEWEDDDTLIVQAGEDPERMRRVVIDLEPLEYGVVSKQHEIQARGWFVDALPLSANQVLWADFDGRTSAVFRTPVAELIRPSTAVDSRYRITELSEPVAYWISDPRGVPRAALALEIEEPLRFALYYRADEKSDWDRLEVWDASDPFPIPVGVAPDGRDLLVVSAERGGVSELRRYRVADRRLGEVIHAQPGADIEGVVFGYHGYEVLAVYWEEAGIRRYHYFDEIDASQQRWLDQLHPGEAVHLTSRSADRKLFTILVSGPSNPGEVQLLDAEKRSIEALGEVMPWIDRSRLAPVTALQVTAKDGTRIEAFLTRPRKWSGKRPPLVVMPHGGPIGVQDTREFDPLVQSLAARGYAVLQVNYRGSGGKGLGFLEAGRGEWGKEIEDDIEAALETVAAQKEVDPDRVCIFGGSYGGYSALIGITRRPQRYRCAAAFAAPSDLLLWSNVFRDSEFGRRWFAKTVGDPDADRERLIAISPAYRAPEINVPLLLIQGDRDTVVDPEHAYRMRAMLDATGTPYEWMLLEGAGHTPTPRQWIQVMKRVDEFLARSLRAPRAT